MKFKKSVFILAMTASTTFLFGCASTNSVLDSSSEPTPSVISQDANLTPPVPESPVLSAVPVAPTELVISTQVQPNQVSKPVIEESAGVALSSDVLFGFNGSSLTPESKVLMDRIIPRLKTLDLEVVLATGHSDRIGNETYNQKLSVKRAEAVKAYLVLQGIPSNKIKVEGKGSSEPVTTPEECKNKKGKDLQECYTPDRRVNLVAQGFTRLGSMPEPSSETITTVSGLKMDTKMTFTVFFKANSIVLASSDNDLLDEIADAAIEAEKVHLRGKTASPGSNEQKKAQAIARGWAVRQALVFRGVEKQNIRVFYNVQGLKKTENNDRVDVELFPKKSAPAKAE